MVQQRCEPCFLVPSCYFSTQSNPFDRHDPALCPGRVVMSVFPLASPLTSTTSAPIAIAIALFSSFASTTGLS